LLPQSYMKIPSNNNSLFVSFFLESVELSNTTVVFIVWLMGLVSLTTGFRASESAELALTNYVNKIVYRMTRKV